jgi:hypothetical protein
MFSGTYLHVRAQNGNMENGFRSFKKTLVWSIFNVSFFNFIDGFQHFLTRDARWFVFKPKIQNWVNFGGPFNGKCRYILWPFGIFYDHLEYFMAIWYNLWPFGIVCGHLLYFSQLGMLRKREIWQTCFWLLSHSPFCVMFAIVKKTN